MTVVDDFKFGMRALAGAVNLVTTGGRGQVRQGLTATAVCSLTVEPPCLIACVNQSASAHNAIGDNGYFCINVLSETQRELAADFADNNAIERRFTKGLWTEMETGAPVLESCLSSFDCIVSTTIDRGTHTIFVGDVVAVSTNLGVAPLLYFNGAYNTLSETGGIKP